MAKVLMKGNEAMAEAAIRAGCKFFFGYPITPQNEIPEYMSRELPLAGGIFVQAESEIAAINMVFGAAGSGARVMTSSSSPGISLKQEGISYIAGAELPCLIINVMRAGPGLGGIQPAQADYFQAVKGGGHGDYRLPVFAPANIQEAVDLIHTAFDVADAYRTPVMILADGMIGQMMEAIEFKGFTQKIGPEKNWATTGTRGKREPNIITSLDLDSYRLEKHILEIKKKMDLISEKECRWEEYNMEDADIVAVAYGTTSRILKSAVETLKNKGINVGILRPITLFPFPYHILKTLPERVTAVLTVEMSTGQMVEDVRLGVEGRIPVHFYGRTGGVIPTPQEIIDKIENILGGGQ
ncbi:3-methyl-2-oxobutanoate dehydrogenase subunit VorB [uncultured Ilyobacter sp.]|uniref:3-methyl-2-oxobutanoate dehydrogenase subunit VorB n=1 Tax=uncultured Ilyobacter sp. TaxID=544433 RepID=UPI0029C71368|nr:3-methyl-2-oxobutanoate dehydrogenase subunit VorB [uncultured Ilyobacter sp.]